MMEWPHILLLAAAFGFAVFVIGFVAFYDRRARRADIKRRLGKP